LSSRKSQPWQTKDRIIKKYLLHLNVLHLENRAKLIIQQPLKN